MPHGSYASRRGFTLIELLVVMLIILAITALAIPVVAPALRTREIRESARGVNTFIGGARDRAVSSGRPFGVRLERLEGQPDAVMTLAYVEVPPPYSGDTLTSVALVDIFPTSGANAINRVRFPSDDVDALLRDGDEIRFGNKGHFYRLVRVSAGVYKIGDGIDSDSDSVYETWNTGSAYSETTSEPFLSPVAGIAFQVIRQPERSSAESLQLPDATAIDLNFSGDAYAPFHRRVNDPDYPDDLHMGDEFAPGDTRPVTIVFGPTGAVDRVYATGVASGGGGPTLIVFRPNSTLYLLVGRRDLMRTPLYPPEDPAPDAINFNWEEQTNIWITINPRTGLVASIENLGAPPLPPAGDPDLTPCATRLRIARQLASEAEGMVGQ